MLYSSEIFSNDYSILKERIITSYREGEVEKCLEQTTILAQAAYKYKFDHMVDNELENVIDEIATQHLGDVTFNANDNRVVFLDSFCWDNKGLTEQYIDALISLDYTILLIVTNDVFHNKGNTVISKLRSYAKGEFKIYRRIERLNASDSILKDIAEFSPSLVFWHPSPWDMVAMLVLRKLKGLCDRYFINITDNHFWLGVNTFDHILEFRTYGQAFSEIFRSIPESKTHVLPFYPIVRDQAGFMGVPIERTKDSVLAISGGNGYKFLGGGNVYARLVSRLLEEKKNMILIIVGAGKEGELVKSRCAASVQDRIHLEPSRPDIFQLIKHCDMYITSAPRVGGVINQMAITAEVPIVSFTYNDIKGFQIHPVSPMADISHCDIDNEDEFFEIGCRLVDDVGFRKEYVKNFASSIIPPETFVHGLERILAGERPFAERLENIELTKEELDKYEQIVVESENGVINEYQRVLGKYMNPNPVVPGKDSKVTFIRKLRFRLSLLAKNAVVLFTRSLDTSASDFDQKQPGFTREKFKSLGKEIKKIPDRYIVVNPQYIEIGEGFSSLYNLRLEAWDSYASQRFLPELSIGNNVSINTDVHIGCINKVQIGNNVLMASRIYISDHSHGDMNNVDLAIPPAKRELFSRGPVIIEDNVWIGEGVAILPDVRIGENSIIGANSVVTKSFPRNSILAGNPARLVRMINE